MKPIYPTLQSPIKVGNLLFKNRLLYANSLPHFLQGPETYPGTQVIHHMVSAAKNGASVVTLSDWTNPNQRESFNEDGRRFPMFDLTDPSAENYLCQLADQVHYYNSHITLALMPFDAPDPDYSVCAQPAVDIGSIDPKIFAEKVEEYGIEVIRRNGRPCKEMTHEMIHSFIESLARRALLYKSFGFDMLTLHSAYRATLFSRFISPISNKRTDKYGGPIENRARFLLELCARVKELCGKDFPIEVQISGHEIGGTTIEETIELAKLAEGYIDIFQFRSVTGTKSAPVGYNSKPHEYDVLDDCAAVKASGTSVLCEAACGFQDPADMEEALSSGKADLISAARAFFADPYFYTKIKEGRADDIVPCVRCNKCHVQSLTGPWVSICTVNPEFGIAHKLDKMVTPVSLKKKVAIVGGGPAGMRAALYCAKRGHAVTLFEQSDRLGGQLKVMDYPTFKWPLKRYRDYLIAQIEKSPIDVKLNTKATRGILEEGGYDAIILALGAKPAMPPIPGAEKCRNVFEVFGHEAELGKRCVVVGGSETGAEVGMYLAENGHDTVVLTRQEIFAPDATPIHYREMMQEYYEGLENFSFILGATTTAVGDGYVEFKGSDGHTRRIECDSVVMLGGMRPLHDEALAMYGLSSETFMIGDCYEVGNIHKCNRGAYASAHQI